MAVERLSNIKILTSNISLSVPPIVFIFQIFFISILRVAI